MFVFVAVHLNVSATYKQLCNSLCYRTHVKIANRLMSYLIFLYFLVFVVWMVDTYLHKRMQKDCYHLVKECSLQQSIGNRS